MVRNTEGKLDYLSRNILGATTTTTTTSTAATSSATTITTHFIYPVKNLPALSTTIYTTATTSAAIESDQNT
ncbi:hypothetical protein E2C01_102855 [Portunus trituberculatus]|uniref:Uncharacterized protein n=1 Tax=Portunus trituberculatus TaxID=210409 RepID=A0A5B7KJC5_PORTR|nr:hypothetical protein [Portunus trituberculatus]